MSMTNKYFQTLELSDYQPRNYLRLRQAVVCVHSFKIVDLSIIFKKLEHPCPHCLYLSLASLSPAASTPARDVGGAVSDTRVQKHIEHGSRGGAYAQFKL